MNPFDTFKFPSYRLEDGTYVKLNESETAFICFEDDILNTDVTISKNDLIQNIVDRVPTVLFKSKKINFERFKKFIELEGIISFKPFKRYCHINICGKPKYKMFGTGEKFRKINFSPYLITNCLDSVNYNTVKIELLQYTTDFKSLFALKISSEDGYLFILSMWRVKYGDRKTKIK